ncbi:hypothetical protein EDC04DRAFT_2914692 [Pisolithus marmoratus]|nr:hypothetical protein EDC04DRAFT_2914692 [Pisolithus marmoratus]
MDLSLKAMEESLKTFHNHKQVLNDLQICEDFNVPKIHSLQHYMSLIRALGSTDGYNTEYPEHLHINYAKDAYHASNKHDYVEQMALWLQHQEAIHHKSAYLAWRQLKRLPCMDSVDSATCGIGKSDSISSDLGDATDQLMCIHAKVQYKVTKYPSHCRVTVDQICAEYKAPDFILALKQFLISLSSQNQAVQLVLPWLQAIIFYFFLCWVNGNVVSLNYVAFVCDYQ